MQGRLAAARGPQQAHELAGRDVQSHAVAALDARLAVAEANVHVAQRDRCRPLGVDLALMLLLVRLDTRASAAADPA